MKLEDIVLSLQQEHEGLTKKGDMRDPGWDKLDKKYAHHSTLYPDDPRLLFQYGTLFMQRQNIAPAIAMFNRSLDCGALGAAPYLNIAAAYKQNHLDERALEYYKKAMKAAEKNPHFDDRGINVDLSFALHGIGSLYVNAGEPNTCLYWSEKALKVDPDDRHALWNKGLALLELGEWEEGFKIYDGAGFTSTGVMPTERKTKTYGGLPKWDGTPGKTVICYGEQGVGDELMFASMLPDLMKDCKVIIDCDPRLAKMFVRSFSDAEAVYPTSEVNAPFEWIKDHKVDAYVPMGSLGMHYRKTAADFPKTAYIKANDEQIAYWADELKRLPPGLNVGISWAGGLKKTRFDQRTIPLDWWEPILKTPGVNFISLQYHKWAADECAEVGRKLNVPIHHWQDAIADYEHTAALLQNLDLVITVNTSLHHLCGSMAVQQWCLTPVMCAWRYGNKGGSPWYGNCEMLRQNKIAEWKPVLSKAASKLNALTNMRAAA